MQPVSRALSLIFAALFGLLSVLPALAYHDDPNQNHPFQNVYFEHTWDRTDKPVAHQRVSRTWVWGPDAYTQGRFEEYAESPNGHREVQYFDKSRMEITHPDAADDSVWYVTNGLLVNELISGKMQLGDNTFEQHDPAQVNVAGDQDDPDAVTYADLAGVFDEPATAVGTALIQRLDDNGVVSNDPSLAGSGPTAAYRVTVPGIDHTVASPFWDFMNSSGLIYTPGNYHDDKLFVNPFYATGFPITEAYWVTVDVAGTEHVILLQCFERRCLTYTPANDPGWQVEFGNVGQHYYAWRYGNAAPTESATIYLVALAEPATASGPTIGCGDEVVPVTVEVPTADSLPGQITNALNALLAIDDQFYGESGLYNALWNSDLSVEEVTIDDGVATVELSGEMRLGGECDDPRVIAQLESTVLEFPAVSDVVLLLNGEPLFGPPNGEEHYSVDLGSLNSSGATGTLELTLAGDSLTVNAELHGLAMHLEHPTYIQGLPDLVSTCPTAANDLNADGILDLAESAPAAGDVLLDLAPAPVANHEADATIDETYQIDSATLGPLDDRVVVVHGMVIMVNGEPQYDESVPVACGLIREDGVDEFHASLNGSNEVPPVDSDANGWFIARLNDGGDVLSWQLAVNNLSQGTEAHIRMGGAGENGDILSLLWFTESTPFSGSGQLWSARLTQADLPQGMTLADLITSMEAGATYVNVQTVAHHDGEIRGQIEAGD